MEASSVRVRPLTTGVVRPKRGERGARRYLPGGWDDATLPVHAFLVEHPAGALLFDTGQEAAAAGPGYFPRWHPFFRLSRFELGPEHEVAAQLERLGRPPSELRWVVLSHLHTDHVGGIAACAAAEILVSATEWQRARGLGGRVRGYLPGRWPSGLRPRLLPLDTDPFGPFSASHDVAGDGSLLVVPLPGHTPGHVGLLVRDARAPVLLAGDAAHDGAALARANPEVAAWCAAAGVAVATAHDHTLPATLTGGSDVVGGRRRDQAGPAK